MMMVQTRQDCRLNICNYIGRIDKYLNARYKGNFCEDVCESMICSGVDGCESI